MIRNIYVPHEGPLDAKILFIGESPGETEEHDKRPFVGEAGQLLMRSLGRAGISRESVYLANWSHYRPADNKFHNLLGSKQLEEGIAEIKELIQKIKPNVICPLGAAGMQILFGKKSIHPWRGSILEYAGFKVIPTFHPSYILRNRSSTVIFDLDIARVVADSTFRELRLPERRYIIDPRGLELEEWVQRLEESDEYSVDIETTRKGDVGTKYILCIGFSNDPAVGVCIPNHQDAATANAYARLLSSKAKKVFHFGTFDTEALYLNGYDTRNFTFDTLTAAHVLNAELPRGLDFLTSIYTREPYYKSSGRAEIPGDTKEWGSKVDRESLYVYNCKDACVTLEIKQIQEKEFSGNDIDFFNYEMSLIPIGHSMSRNGMPIDQERKALFDKALIHRWYKLQVLLNNLCGKDVNVRSPKLKDILYTDLGLPVKRKRDGSITTDEDAIVDLITFVTGKLDGVSRPDAVLDWKTKQLILKTILEIRGIRQERSNYIIVRQSNDLRYRSIYKYSSTETGRGACEKYIDDSGVNAQTFPRGSVDVPENLGDVPTFDLGEEEEVEDELDV